MVYNLAEFGAGIFLRSICMKAFAEAAFIIFFKQIVQSFLFAVNSSDLVDQYPAEPCGESGIAPEIA